MSERLEQFIKNVAKSPFVMEATLVVGTTLLGYPLLDSLKVFASSEPDHRTTVGLSSRGDRPDWQTDEDKSGIPLSTFTSTSTPTETPTPPPTATSTHTAIPTEEPTPTPEPTYAPEFEVEIEKGCIKTGVSWKGEASYYSANGCLGCRSDQLMANGERFNQWALTLAFMRLPLNSTVLVTNLENGISSLARVTDRGGFEPYGRLADLSLGLKDAIAGYDLTPVRIDGCYSR